MLRKNYGVLCVVLENAELSETMTDESLCVTQRSSQILRAIFPDKNCDFRLHSKNNCRFAVVLRRGWKCPVIKDLR